MNIYEISYEYRGYLEVVDVDANDILGAIGQFFKNTDGKINDIIRVEVKQ